ncbi:MAG: hypothetical protein ACOYYS_16985 [Chloroflexota bacterium]
MLRPVVRGGERLPENHAARQTDETSEDFVNEWRARLVFACRRSQSARVGRCPSSAGPGRFGVALRWDYMITHP